MAAIRSISKGFDPVGVVLCTSTTHPANPFPGMRIYETNTGNELTYQSATTGWTPPWSAAWGNVAAAYYSASGVTTATTTFVDATGGGITWTAIANRNYDLHGKTNLVGSTVAGDVLEGELNDGTQLVIVRALAATTANAGADLFYNNTYSAGSVNVKFRVRRLSGTGTITASRVYLAVRDVGPSAAPL